MLRKINFKLAIDELILLLNYITFFVRWMDNISYEVTTYIWLGTGVISFFYIFFSYRKVRKYMVIMVFVYLFVVLNELISKNQNPIYCVVGLICEQTLGILIFKRQEKTRKLCYLTYGFAIYVFILTFSLFRRDGVVRLSKMVNFNTVSILMIMFTAIYIIHCHNNKKTISYFLPCITLLSSIMAGGIGGILSSTLLILCLLLFKRNQRINIKMILIMLLIVVAVLATSSLRNSIFGIVNENNSRFWIWATYFDSVISNDLNILTGANVDSIPFLFMQHNMHNTYINWHYMYGLIPFVFNFALIIWSLIMTLKRKIYLFTVIMTVTMVRAFTDETGFCFMPIWIYIFLYMKLQKGQMEDRKRISKDGFGVLQYGK